MTRKEIVDLCITIVEDMRKTEWVPNPRTRGKTSTGNMAFNALKYAVLGDQFVIWVDDSISPYAPCTEGPWLAQRWNNKKNPNEGWWERLREEFARRLAAELGGTMQ